MSGVALFIGFIAFTIFAFYDKKTRPWAIAFCIVWALISFADGDPVFFWSEILGIFVVFMIIAFIFGKTKL